MAKRHTMEVPSQPVKHRREPSYLFATRERARSTAEALVKSKLVKARGAKLVEMALWFAMDDARTAGFGAGVAYGLCLRRRR